MKNRQETECPTRERLILAFQGEMSLSEKTAILRHVIECPDCAQKLEFLQSLRLELKDKVDDLAAALARDAHADGLPSPGGLRPRTGHLHSAGSGRVRFGGPAWKFAAGAAALLVIISAGYLLWKNFDRESGIRSAGSTTLTLLHPLGLIAEPPRFFEWTPVGNSDAYILRLTDSDLRIVLRDDVKEIRYVIPQDRIRLLRRGVSYTWTVTAIDDFNNILAEKSGAFTIAFTER